MLNLTALLFCLWIATGGVAFYLYEQVLASRELAAMSAASLKKEYDGRIAAAQTQKMVLQEETARLHHEIDLHDKDAALIQKLQAELTELREEAVQQKAHLDALAAVGAKLPVVTNQSGPDGEEWTTTDNRQFHHVRVVHSDAKSVTILDDSGGATLLLETLLPELQKRFGYKPSPK